MRLWWISEWFETIDISNKNFLCNVRIGEWFTRVWRLNLSFPIIFETLEECSSPNHICNAPFPTEYGTECATSGHV